MEFKEVSLKDIIPNPYRDLKRYPLSEDKVGRLRESVRETGFWSNVLARRKGSKYELAYGHHRIEAARRELGTSAEVNIIVREIDDTQMLKIMASENDDWQLGMPISLKLEVLEAALKMLGLSLGSRHRQNTGDRASSAAKLLNWDRQSTSRYLALLNALDSGVLSRKVVDVFVSELEPSMVLMRACKSALLMGKKITEKKQLEIAEEAVKHRNTGVRVKILASDYLHPIKPLKPSPNVEELLKEAAARARALDVVLTLIRDNHLSALHNGTYAKSLEAFNLAASLQGVVDLTKQVFGKAQLKSAPKKEIA